jgi:hypothetical protein
VEKMTSRLPPEIAKRIQELSPQVASLDLLKIMELEVLDFADWVVSEFTDICRGNVKECAGEVEELLRDHINRVVESADTLFSKFYNYKLPETLLHRYYERANEILREYLAKFLNGQK